MSVDVVTSVAEMRRLADRARCAGHRVGFVPTMGFLHEGHASLMRAARGADDLVVTSIFVNPLQFSPDEDLDAYPRDLDRDLGVCAAAGVDVVFAPTVAEMYPRPVSTTVTVSGVSEPLEGRSRPAHFAGVATVVAKLFAIVGPCRAYFGEKDWQQLRVVATMVADLSLPVEVVGCPIVREADGLALSSRNVYLTPDERAQAPVLYRALRTGADLVAGGETDAGVVEAAMAAVVAGAPLARLDYVAAVQADTLVVEGPLHGEVRLLGAVQLGRARLIDNLGVRVPEI